MSVSQARALAIRTTLCLAVIACGLGLRIYGLGWGLPAAIVKYGGSVLWGTMVFLLVTLAAPRLARPQAIAIAAVIATAVELSRLVHTPSLDAFRLTLAGALLLGRIFSMFDIAAYGVGILLGAALERLALRAAERRRLLSE
jgi:hypothetical protein